MSWQLLERFIESSHFSSDPSLAICYLFRYSQHVGISYVLCTKLRSFAYEEIEFFLPQLCHLLVSVDNESMALEEFIIDLCQESVHGALLTFWLFQTHLHDLSSDPQSNSFKTCRRIFNKVQHIVFGASEPLQAEKIHENVMPTTVLASIVLAGVAAPFLPRSVGPLAIAQARKPQPLEDTISEAPPLQKLSRSHTVSGTASKTKRPKSSHSRSGSKSSGPASPAIDGQSKASRPLNRPRQGSTRSIPKPGVANRQASLPGPKRIDSRISSLSQSDLPRASAIKAFEESTLLPRPSLDDLRRHSYTPDALSPLNLTPLQKTHLLRSHYFRSETAFLTALEGISNRLVVLPKPARLSALRAELALIAQDLPAEVDIPLLCPASLEDGAPSQSRHHRIVRLNPAEATSLNSAERVPYLLMVEILRDDFDFNPDTPANQRLLSTLMLDKESNKRRPFDITAASRTSVDFSPQPDADSTFEPSLGDLSSPNLLKDIDNEDDPLSADFKLSQSSRYQSKTPPPNLSNGLRTNSTGSLLVSPIPDSPVSRASSPGMRKQSGLSKDKGQTPEQPDISALATHMRTAAQMLAQLDVSGSKRPRHEVENIRAKIIASMQNLEEQSFTSEGPSQPTFDTIMANVTPVSIRESTEISEVTEGSVDGPAVNTAAGAARMENDQKTGGVRRKGDRDDPSAATFGEDWKSKKDRIRRTSPYGWMKNWDLISVIVKTGSDLRQELFACQLIRICAKIWEEAEVPVWVKQMRILVTGESSGLIETITNGVSVHSLKRSLTLSTIAAGTNPRKRFCTLADHFKKTFGEPDQEAYKAGQEAFMRSLAAYSMISYILQLKDRHNGNILIDNQGHVVHIDFGFMLSNSPGSMGFEAAPFKLTQDYVDVLGGVDSPVWAAFRTLCKQAFQALRKSAENIVMLVELMSKESKMACFSSGAVQTTATLRQRFMLHLSKEEAETFVDNDLIGKSLGSYYTRLYDTFQYRTQGIY